MEPERLANEWLDDGAQAFSSVAVFRSSRTRASKRYLSDVIAVMHGMVTGTYNRPPEK